MQNLETEIQERTVPRVIVIGLASCFGCQLQITNMERYLTDIVGQIDLVYWQLASSEPMPENYDVAIIEGAVTTEESEATVREARAKANAVITIGACANTAGIPGMAAEGFLDRPRDVYDSIPDACGRMIPPRSVPSVIDVDYQVFCCPIDFYDFTAILMSALYGSNRRLRTATMCGECKRRENNCFYQNGELCLGLVTLGGCDARCPSLGRPCNGCRGLSPEANLEAARQSVSKFGVDVADFDKALEMFNQTNPVIRNEG